jgi:hypothetical protein
MTTLRLRVDKYLWGGEAFAPAEVVNPSGDVAFRGPIPVGSSTPPLELELAPGPYLIRATLPSGEVVSESKDVQGVVAESTLRGHHSAHEWLSWHEFATGEGELTERRIAEQQLLWRSLGDDLYDPRSGEVPHFTIVSSNGMTYTHRVPKSGGVVRGLGVELEVETESDREFFLVRVVGRAEGGSWIDPRHYPRIYLSASAPEAQLQFVALPAPWTLMSGGYEHATVEILLRRAPANAANDPKAGPIASLVIREQVFGSLLSFLAAGDPASAGDVSKALYDEAQSLLWGKLANPYAAAAGGYVLVRTLRGAELPDWYSWLANLDNWFPWMPDGAVLHGWQQLLQGDDESIEIARNCFIEAVRRGVPIYTDGVRLLVRGLSRLSRDPALARDRALHGALHRARIFASAVDPTKPFTTLIDSDSLGLGKTFGVGHLVVPPVVEEWMRDMVVEHAVFLEEGGRGRVEPVIERRSVSDASGRSH